MDVASGFLSYLLIPKNLIKRTFNIISSILLDDKSLLKKTLKPLIFMGY